MSTGQSTENYLETILILTEKTGYVRSIDVANELQYSKPSISVAFKKMRSAGLIEVDEHGGVTLTKKGLEIAKGTFERHNILSKCLISIGVSEETAKADACLIEHIISDESFDKIKEIWEKEFRKQYP